MNGFMQGVRVVELATHDVGPITGLTLKPFGAELIKTEETLSESGYSQTEMADPKNQKLI